MHPAAARCRQKQRRRGCNQRASKCVCVCDVPGARLRFWSHVKTFLVRP
jgi:hypothetical protein